MHLAWQQAQARTDELFQLIQPESLFERPVPLRHRLIFYLGHLEAFDWNLICRYQLSVPSFHEEFDKLFAFGIDPDEGGVPKDKPSDWPVIGEIQAYNRRIRETVARRFREVPPQLTHVAIEHRLMHAETLAYLLHNLPHDRKLAPAAASWESGPAPANPMLDVSGGIATLGRATGDGFGWDNEFEQHTVPVRGFSISKYKVTNGEYLDFVRAGGEPPHFWSDRDGQWLYRGMFREGPLPLDWPVYVTHDQAVAFAQWKEKSLPTEAQLARASFGAPDGSERLYPWGDAEPEPAHGNFDFQRWDPVAVTATPEGDSAFGVSQLAGNGWEWTSTVFAPFPGFEKFPFYPGYSADFFDDQHYVLKGGSPRTAAALLRRSFRNWFRPRYPYAYTGFHLVEN